MRLTSDFFVSAYLRRCQSEGLFAALRQRGAAEAGAILVIVDRLDGHGTLYGPAPQSAYAEQPSGRLFARLHAAEILPLGEIESILARQKRFDPDLWVVEVESRTGQHFLDAVS